jgi:hypothetical protein
LLGDRGENLMGPDVPEMEVRREPAGRGIVEVEPIFVVAVETVLDEPA